MKTIVKTFLLVALMFGTLMNYANENNTSTSTSDAKKVTVEFKAVKKGQHIKIKDKNGVNIYNQEIENNGNYSKSFNLSALKEGLYTVELNKDYEILVKTFKVEAGLVTFLNDESVKIYKPVIRNENNLVLISKIAFNNSPVKVVIYFNDDVILSETINGNGVINKVYKLSESEKGDYSVVINSDERMYSKEFEL